MRELSVVADQCRRGRVAIVSASGQDLLKEKAMKEGVRMRAGAGEQHVGPSQAGESCLKAAEGDA
jgi:hypothetical protein